MVRNFIFASAAMALAAAPVAAEQAKVELSRDSAPVSESNQLIGNQTLFLLIGIAVVAAGIFLLSEDNDDPVSV